MPAGTKENGGQRPQEGAQRMAIYHCSIKIISRGKGKSAVAAAAYRSGETLTNEYDGVTHDYTRKGGIVHTEILLPDHAPAQYADRAVLWNAVEKIEKAKNAQLAREIEIALPHELTREQGISLIREYVKEQFVSAGMCADIAIHDKEDGNPHAHVMLTIRPIEQDGSWGAKQKKEYILDKDGNKIYDQKKRSYKCKSIPATNWNEQTKAEEWRGAWAEICNLALEQNGHTERIDHRSYARQGIDKIPTVHLGVAAFQMEKRGIRTERGNLNREIEVTNRRLRQLKARISKLQSWLKEEATKTETPTLADVIQWILLKREQAGKQSRYTTIHNLKAAANMLNFLTANSIKDMDGLEEKVMDMYDEQRSISEKLKPIDRRLKTLDEHISNAEKYMQYRSIYRQYKQQKPKKQEAFYETHRMELTHYEAAARYLDGVMNGRTTLPTKAWKTERDKLKAERQQLSYRYDKLKNEVKEIEQIRRNVYSILRDENRSEQPQRTNDLDR
ncbi:MobQ family relaxase [Bacteroides pyogenes]|uniref:MobQ family relaxase n=1 Tax=Bacteroides pyogenes TaxID=310300 RepID=UPI002FDA8CA0